MAASVDELAGTKLGNFRLVRVLGRGRMGVVYLARDEALLRTTAVKILSWALPVQHGQDPEEWFLAEARAMARINHPAVVQIYIVAKHHSRCYIAMEYVAGASADVLIAERGLLAPERATEILVEAARGLQAAHEANVVHRDVKPENLLVATSGPAKLVDFGMARPKVAAGSVELVRAGTPFYTAPEMWRGEAATPGTDIYALGATYVHLLTGRPPFDVHELQALMSAHITAPAPNLQRLVPSIPAACNQIAQKCLAKSARDRYATAAALAEAASLVFKPQPQIPSRRPPP